MSGCSKVYNYMIKGDTGSVGDPGPLGPAGEKVAMPTCLIITF